MTGDCHCLVAGLALACLPTHQQRILHPQWAGIEGGATLSDHLRIMWEPESAESTSRQLVHRCFVDSDDDKDHGCITRALDYAEGTVSFIRDYLAGELEGSYDEAEFLENLGMFLGVESHHIADLCTAVHVGHVIDFRVLGFRSLSRLHHRVERDLERYSRSVTLRLRPPSRVGLDRDFLWDIARHTYQTAFLALERVYAEPSDDLLEEMTSATLSEAVRHTADIWFTILETSGMTGREWPSRGLSMT